MLLPANQDDPFAEFKVTFFEECAELLTDMEQQLAVLEGGNHDSEVLNAIFRAVHSIKAGAAAFSFDRMVTFTHKFETMLDKLRDGNMPINEHLFKVLFKSFDILSDLVGFAQEGQKVSAEFGAEELELIKGCISGEGFEFADAAGEDAPAQTEEPAPVVTVDVVVTSHEERAPVPATKNVGQDTPSERYRIDFTPKYAMYRNANEPLLIIRELETLGDLEVLCDLSSLPPIAEMEPEDAYLSWVFALTTDEGRDAIDEVFEFVVDDCDLVIVEIDDVGNIVDVGVTTSSGRSGEGYGFFEEEQAAIITEGLDACFKDAAIKEPEPSAPVQTEARQAPVVAPATTKPDALKATLAKVSSIRVDIDRVDKLVNMVGELVITQSMLAQEFDNVAGLNNKNVEVGMEDLANHTREMQDNVMAIRMQPVKSVFSRMPRLVRDISTKLSKKVKLVTTGEDTEVDKTVVEELSDPLTHMIRNSLDHGMEMPADRIAQGKPEEGVVHLSAEHRGGRIIIEVTDDGAGINREVVRRKAIEKGLIEADAEMSDSEIDSLIFEPGFSTADEVTALSGRGVGMDVVRRNIQSLGGRVSVQSYPGRGTRFQLTLPLTLAVLDGMIVEVGTEKYVIPINNIIETVRPRREQIESLVTGGTVMEIRGDYVRVVQLSQVFGLEGEATDIENSLVVIAEADGGKTIGIAVDRLVGQQQVVIKSLEANYLPVEGISSATILGNGNVCLILDVDDLGEMDKRYGDPGGGTPKSGTRAAAAE